MREARGLRAEFRRCVRPAFVAVSVRNAEKDTRVSKLFLTWEKKDEKKIKMWKENTKILLTNRRKNGIITINIGIIVPCGTFWSLFRGEKECGENKKQILTAETCGI